MLHGLHFRTIIMITFIFLFVSIFWFGATLGQCSKLTSVSVLKDHSQQNLENHTCSGAQIQANSMSPTTFPLLSLSSPIICF